MELRDYLRVIAKHWLGITLITALVTSAVAVWTFLQPRVYTANAQTFVAIASSNESVDLGGGASYTQSRLASYVQLIRSPDVLVPVIEELDLDMSATGLAGSVSASNPTDTVLINISVRNLDPVLAASIANATASQMGSVIQALETSSAGDIVPVKVTLTNPAEPPGSPSSPRTRTNIPLGVLIGLALGVGYAFLRESLDTTVKSPDELTQFTGATPLGLIAFDPDAETKPLVALESRASRSEAFRTIRTNLQYVDVDHPPRAVAITSAIPNEGKTTTSINLAITMAQAGKQVVLVETDLRRPRASGYLGIESQVGLTDVLAGQVKLEDAMLPWNRDLLTVVPSGRTPPNPSELLASQQFAEVIEQLKADFDQVIIDTTPLLAVTDGAIVSKVADGAVVVIRFGKTTREQLAASIDALEQVDARLLGTVMNFIPTGRRSYGYKYGYGYGYGYHHESKGESASAT